MRRQAQHAVLGLVLAALSACSSGRSKEAVATGEQQGTESLTSVDTQLALADAGIAPVKERAVAVLQRFAERLLAKDLAGARAEMRIPASLNEKQVVFFLRELGNGEHLSEHGLAAVLEKDFGLLQERLGDKSTRVAEGAELSLEEAYALGDSDSAVILHWDGSRFWVAALHELGP